MNIFSINISIFEYLITKRFLKSYLKMLLLQVQLVLISPRLDK